MGFVAANALGLITRGITRGQNGVEAVLTGFEKCEADTDAQPVGFAIPLQRWYMIILWSL
jgi:hypothetical protein